MPPGSIPALVTLHVWRVPASRSMLAVGRIARDRTAVRRYAGVRFAKALGTGRGQTFTPRDADFTKWALLTTWSDASAAAAFEQDPYGAPARWRRFAAEQLRLDLTPVASHGLWSGAEPFGSPVPRRTGGPVAALTRGRIAPRQALELWRSTPPVATAVRRAPGLVLTFGIGEAPIGLQGTFSVWESNRTLRAFAYQDPTHQSMIEKTRRTGWYSEDLFARFEVTACSGTLGGLNPLANTTPTGGSRV